MIEISTSILNIEEEKSLRTFYDLEVARIDVMDGTFVENDTTKKMLEYASNIKKISNLPLDVHLMVKDTKKYIEEYLEEIKDLLEYIHMLLVMTVEPGKGGQKLIPETLEKIKELNKYREEKNLDFYIEADGGINLDTVESVKKAGVDIIVAGTAVVNSEDYKSTIKELKK